MQIKKTIRMMNNLHLEGTTRKGHISCRMHDQQMLRNKSNACNKCKNNVIGQRSEGHNLNNRDESNQIMNNHLGLRGTLHLLIERWDNEINCQG